MMSDGQAFVGKGRKKTFQAEGMEGHKGPRAPRDQLLLGTPVGPASVDHEIVREKKWNLTRVANIFWFSKTLKEYVIFPLTTL